MVHVSEISAEKRIEHPQDVLKTGQIVEAQVLALDLEKRQIKLSMKQLVPTGLDEYIAEHKVGDIVTGRTIDETGAKARVELGEGILATCNIAAAARQAEPAAELSTPAKADLGSLSAMLKSRWKEGPSTAAISKNEPARAGQIRSYRITKLDAAAKKIELEQA
jgi:small subunit ribosomal protein S1